MIKICKTFIRFILDIFEGNWIHFVKSNKYAQEHLKRTRTNLSYHVLALEFSKKWQFREYSLRKYLRGKKTKYHVFVALPLSGKFVTIVTHLCLPLQHCFSKVQTFKIILGSIQYLIILFLFVLVLFYFSRYAGLIIIHIRRNILY